MKRDHQTPEEAFALIEAAAAKGERCPMNKPFGPIKIKNFRSLTASGMIDPVIYGHGWRVVTILVGQHRGKHTMLDPRGGAPHRLGGVEKLRRRMQPSLPRPLTREELA